MASRSLGTLTLDLVAKIGGFTGPLEQASRNTKKQMTNIAGSVKTATVAIAAAGTTAAAAAAGVVAFTNRAAENARELKNQASVANASVTEFQRLSYASTTVGVEQDKLADILKDVNDRVGDFLNTGGGEMKEFFEQIAPQVGITAEQFRNLSGPQALQLYYDSLEKANLSQAEMTFYLESMANDTTALIPLLRDGGAGFADMADEADRLGIVLSEVDVAKLNEFAVQFDRLSSIMGSMGNILAAELAPYLSVLGDYIIDAAEGADGLREALPGAIYNSVAAIGPLLDKFRELQVLDQQVKVGTAEMNLAFAEFAEGAWGSMEWFLNTAIAGVNNLIRGINAIPGVDEIELLGWFSESDFMGRITQQTIDAQQALEGYAQELQELISAPLPSENIDQYLADVQAKVDELRAKLESEGGVLGDDSSPRTLADIENGFNGAADAADNYGTTGKAAMDKVDGAARDLGMTFESAFEDAIVKGEDFRTVLDGILQDILRIAVRKSVSEPVGDAIAGFDWGSLFGGGQSAGQTFGSSQGVSPAAIDSAISISGIAHQGIDRIPKEGTWLLDTRERVLSAPQADKLDQFLAKQNSGGYAGPGLAPLLDSGTTVQIIDQRGSGEKAQVEESRGVDGRKLIKVLIRDEMKSALSDGSMDRPMANSYGVRRRS